MDASRDRRATVDLAGHMAENFGVPVKHVPVIDEPLTDEDVMRRMDVRAPSIDVVA